ncbi:hypothetical protein H920_14266 [Fukomys damarensis]|uniref:Uncharacterized protein n=1 Tax=Fukomys damarensis TaxID=885580 RepID=A0A091DNH1_FUKDA|nr:hypothetical protein H920_14266 [Fukomys damarensis]
MEIKRTQSLGTAQVALVEKQLVSSRAKQTPRSASEPAKSDRIWPGPQEGGNNRKVSRGLSLRLRVPEIPVHRPPISAKELAPALHSPRPHSILQTLLSDFRA